MQRHRITNVHFVPTMIHTLLQQPDVRSVDLGALRLMFYAASCIPAELLRRATQVFSGCGFVQGYGSTEAGMVSCLTPEDHRQAAKPGSEHLLLSCGRALPGVEVGIEPVSPDDPNTGEIVVTSPMTMARYWKNPDATRTIRSDGRLRTGDIAHRDDEGFLAILDRKSDMIVTGGENVYPREVEEVLFRHPAILDAAVFDLPDQRWVQRVVAAVVVRPDVEADAEGIIASMRRELAAYKCPKQVFLTSALPKNGAGKVLRKVLRSTYADTPVGSS
jgi:acyl-CoA synthetase (AMP-forming)/AMP-acid ligase II